MSLLPDYAYAHGKPVVDARFKRKVDDFRVEEILGFTPDGEGEHLWLWIEKTDMTTDEVVRHLSRVSGVKRRDISYAGIKDKVGITRQWVSLRIGIKPGPETSSLTTERMKILAVQRNSRKLRRGSHKGNRFSIVLGGCASRITQLESALETLQRHGVPNYFGPQRFGYDGGNVKQALECARKGQWPRDRFRRGMLLSTARSWLFNQNLSARVAEGNWDQICPGDYCMLNGTQRGFNPEPDDTELAGRLAAGDIHPAAILWGRGAGAQTPYPSDEQDQVLAVGLEQAGVDVSWRALRLAVEDASMTRGGGDDLVVEFSLGRGAYATAVLRELVNVVMEKP